MSKYAIEVSELEKKFDSFTAVDKISFSLDYGKIFGFVGPNGAGKTTTINILCTLIEPTSGKIEVSGYDVQENPREVRKSIGILFQDSTLDLYLTAWENLKFHSVVYHLPKDTQDKRINEMLDLLGLSRWKNTIVKTFSGGMKRRLEIARALLHKPKILFLDEPTIGLDPQTRYIVWQYIKTLIKHENMTVFLTTHYMEEAENCDHIAVIDNGKIVAHDTPKNLKEKYGKDNLDEVFLHLTGIEPVEEEIGESERIKDVVKRRK